ncbi:hypothetical protein AC578_9319 [Pseudocercospora eumusae]|uniref:Gfd2/YDR514C-like C-terminal domain-containing protein n=1 Tax=Pseudocercospora eumusae TaxID=321146 RepID=A0A139HN20_9PEZI|nr:hypothetical protein AC578_9319 [Pseudocercospora eumusae]
MSICNGTFWPLQQTEPYASSSVHSDSQKSGEKSFKSSERPESRSTSLTDPEDVSSKDVLSDKCEAVNLDQSKAEATSVTNQALAVDSSNSPYSSTPVLLRQSGSDRISGCIGPTGALQQRTNSQKVFGVNNSQSRTARSTLISPEISRSARLVAQSSSTRSRLPARATLTGLSNSNKVTRLERSVPVKTRTPAPAIRHARRDMQFNMPGAARPDVSAEMNRASLRISGGSIEKTTKTNAHLRQLLGTVSNHKNLHLNQKTLLDLSSVLDLPAPTNQQEYEMLRMLIGKSQAGTLGEKKNSYSEVKGEAGLADLKPKIGYFSHQSMPDIRMPNTGIRDKSQRTSRLSYSYRGPLDLTYASRDPCHLGLPPGRASFVDSAETRTVSELNRVGPSHDDFLLLETQLVPCGSIASTRESRRRRWSISESRPLAFSYKLASSNNAGGGGPSKAVAPIPTPSLVSVPSVPDLLPAPSRASHVTSPTSSVYRGDSSWRDSKLGLNTDGWSVRTPSVKSTATDYWNNVYSSNPAVHMPAHLSRPSLYAAVAEQPTHENRTTDAIDWAQLGRAPSLVSESGHSNLSLTSSPARQWARHPRVEVQSAQRRDPSSEPQEVTSKAMQRPKPTGGWRRLFTHRPFSRRDDGRNTAHKDQVGDGSIQPSQPGKEEIVIPRELPNPHERPMFDQETMGKDGDLSALQQMLGLRPANLSPASLQDAVIICIDCEAYELDHNKVTEVGVSMFDTRDAPEAIAETSKEELFSKIVSSHYRIEEYGHLRNNRFSKGNPGSFAFGTSTWTGLADIKQTLQNVFEDAAKLSPPLTGLRKIVFVGHAIKNDLEYLRKLNFDINDIPSVVLKLDTQTIAVSKKRQMGLAKLLAALQIVPTHLHNAGNDAAYTLRALLAIAIGEHTDPGSTLRKLEAVTVKPKTTLVRKVEVSSVGTTGHKIPATTLHSRFTASQQNDGVEPSLTESRKRRLASAQIDEAYESDTPKSKNEKPSDFKT